MQYQKQLLKNTLEEQQQYRQQQQVDIKRRAIEQEQQMLQEQAKALEYDELQRKQIQKIKQKELSEAYEQSINQKKQNQNTIKQKQIQDEYNLVSQAQQYQDLQRQQKIQQQKCRYLYESIIYQLQIAQASMDDKMRKIIQLKEQQEQEKMKEQLNQRDEEMRITEKQKQYKDYYKQVAEQQERMQKNFAEKIGSDKQFQIDNMINRGIENVHSNQKMVLFLIKIKVLNLNTTVQYKEEMEAQQKKQSQLYNKQMMRDSLQKQIFEKEQSTKNQNASQIMSNGFRSVENNQIDPQIHNTLLNPIPGYNQNPYLNQRSQLGTYGNQVLKMY